MKNSNGKTRVALVAICTILQCAVAGADYPKEIGLSSKQKQMKVGEPLILRLTYRFEKPQVSGETQEIYSSMGPESSLRITANGEEILEPTLVRPDLYPQDTKGMTYSGNFIIFYDSFKRRLIFETPGLYTITIRSTTTTKSNPLDIQVLPASQSQKELLSLLSDPNDYAFVSDGTAQYFKKQPERIAHIKKVIEKFENTVLAQMAAAQLGLEYFRQFHAEHPSFVKFKQEYHKGEVKEPLFEEAHKYLTIGAKLPDEFPIREDVLKELVIAEFAKGNPERAISLVDELGTKYSRGKHGKNAAKWKQELLDIQKGEPK